MTEAQLESDRKKFAMHAQDFWKAIKDKNSDRANHETRCGDLVVSRWAEQKGATDLLLPLLAHDDPAVRFAAAAHLLNHGAKEEAVRVMRSLLEEPVGLIKSSVRLTLMRNQIPLSES
jgi:hypothetical protein